MIFTNCLNSLIKFILERRQERIYPSVTGWKHWIEEKISLVEIVVTSWAEEMDAC